MNDHLENSLIHRPATTSTAAELLSQCAQKYNVAPHLLSTVLRMERSPDHMGPRGINIRVERLIKEASRQGENSLGFEQHGEEETTVTETGLEGLRIQEIRLGNFGLFKDLHLVFEPEPHRPIYLIEALNGFGKSTVIRALLFALHGKHGIHSFKFPQRMLHKGVEGSRADMSVEVTFVSATEGLFTIKRALRFERGTTDWRQLDESTDIARQAPQHSIHSKDAVNWLAERFPSEVLSYFIFDAEHSPISTLAGQLGETLPNVKDQVEAVMGIQLIRKAAERCRQISKNLKEKRAQLIEQGTRTAVEADLDKVREDEHQVAEQIDEHKHQLEEVSRAEDELKEDIQRALHHLSQIGANQRSEGESAGRLKEQRDRVQVEIDAYFRNVLPLQWLKPLVDHIAHMRSETSRDTLQLAWIDGAHKTVTRFAELAVQGQIPWSEAPMPSQKEIEARLVSLLDLPAREPGLVIDIADDALRTLQQRVATALKKPSLGELYSQLNRITRRLRDTADQTETAPHIRQAHEAVAALRAEQSMRAEERRRLEAELEDLQIQQRALQNKKAHLQEQMVGMHAEEEKRLRLQEQLDMSRRVSQALQDLADEVCQQRIEALERTASGMLRRLTNKPDYYHGFLFNRSTLRYQLVDPDGQPVPADRSTGERTVVALAILHGLQQASEREFPLVVEAPLKPLDPEHTQKVVHHFFGAHHGQMILLLKPRELPAELQRIMTGRVCQRWLFERPYPNREMSIGRQVPLQYKV